MKKNTLLIILLSLLSYTISAEPGKLQQFFSHPATPIVFAGAGIYSVSRIMNNINVRKVHNQANKIANPPQPGRLYHVNPYDLVRLFIAGDSTVCGVAGALCFGISAVSAYFALKSRNK
ncbi:hypothetical protein HYX58_04820 [Candidatus Dependentiae bacterium]|nr:hypothetical protein [Candidatus Dependentiae bacterium]